MLHERLQPLEIKEMPLAKVPPRKERFGGPLALSKVHWVRPELVAQITYLSWSDDGLLRHTVFLGLREDKPARKKSRRKLGCYNLRAKVDKTLDLCKLATV
jgi:bifunctional non-homologous end joining protein LigD